MKRLIYAGLLAFTLTNSALPADTAVKLTADDLLRLARPSAGECYAVKPPANVIPGPERLFAWRSDGGAVTVRVPVPADGYYAVSSLGLWGPWAEGRLGRFLMTAGDAKFPGAYQGWYGTPPNPPYGLREFNWGVAYLSAPAVDLSFEPAGGGGRLLILADLKLQPRSADGLKPEDRDRKVPAAVTATAAPAGPGTSWPVFDMQQVGGNEWTVFVPHVQQAPQIDGKFVSLYRAVLTSAAIRTLADKPTAPHKIENIEPVEIWRGGAVPNAADIPLLDGVEFHVIKQQRPDTDGGNWTLGVGLAWHKGKLYASYGFNQGGENTPTEEAHVRTSSDGGKTWGAPVVMDHGEGNLGVSHGVFLSHAGRLWAFMGAFYDKFQRTHTRAYSLNETTGAWETQGVVIANGFWPMQEPQKMANGNWIMAGARVSHGYDVVGDLPAVAISRGDDFTRWDLVVIPAAPGLGQIWGESTVIVESKRILNISRYGAKALALASVSEDHGRTWTPTALSNLPMATSKPYAGVLSTGQRYLVCTTTADTGGRRSPLTIAVSKPGESVFSKVFLIRTSVSDKTPGVSAANADFSYPYAVEHEGKLYIGYTHKSHAANELAVIPIRSLESQP